MNGSQGSTLIDQKEVAEAAPIPGMKEDIHAGDRGCAAEIQGRDGGAREVHSMSTVAIAQQVMEASPLRDARIAGVLYLLTIVLGSVAHTVHGALGAAADFLAGACFVAVTLLFYDLFKPVHRNLSLLATFLGLMEIKTGGLEFLGVDAGMLSVGLFSLLIGYLIFKSAFLPRILGGLMALAGVGWLMSASPSLAKYLAPYNLAPGIVGTAAITLWLLIKGVDAERWKQQAQAGRL